MVFLFYFSHNLFLFYFTKVVVWGWLKTFLQPVLSPQIVWEVLLLVIIAVHDVMRWFVEELEQQLSYSLDLGHPYSVGVALSFYRHGIMWPIGREASPRGGNFSKSSSHRRWLLPPKSWAQTEGDPFPASTETVVAVWVRVPKGDFSIIRASTPQKDI